MGQFVLVERYVVIGNGLLDAVARVTTGDGWPLSNVEQDSRTRGTERRLYEGSQKPESELSVGSV
jgi:hypothetical protein